ncbi:MAG: FeoB-associated Cys-rich membrane protein [Oscillospiraceae bacterium]|nr:FeoB-associated Cys-rich membrane protein [Oscillospiraceae bacterium]
MLAFLSDNLATVLISAGLLLLVILIVRKLHKDRKAGRGGCAGCEGCSFLAECDNKKNGRD